MIAKESLRQAIKKSQEPETKNEGLKMCLGFEQKTTARQQQKASKTIPINCTENSLF